MRKLLIVGFSLLFVLVFSMCNKDKTEKLIELPDYCTDTVSFIASIKPIFDMNCSTSGCHDAATNSAGYTLVGYEDIFSEAEASLEAMQHNPSRVAMPYLTAKLSDSIIQKLECWILQGKLNN
ncbi:MAG: hypothetical protein ACPGU5_02500 [Lishizhenia sp.]